MQFNGIRECGANNVLTWAIANGANVSADQNLISIINDETYYMLEFTGVNFLELFKLSQIYRDKIRVVKEYVADIPTRKVTSSLFKGELVDGEGDNVKKTPYYEIAEYACKSMINLSLQMNTDDDIIDRSTCRLYVPMLCRTFDIQIPFAFADLIIILANKGNLIFNREYPATLNMIVEDDEFNVARDMLMITMFKNTQVLYYEKEYEQLLKVTKYSSLRKVKSNDLTKHKLVAFYKYDPVTHAEIRCDMFNTNATKLESAMKVMGRLNTPLHVEFAIQVPFQYMFDLLNTYSANILKVKFDTSIADTLETGLIMNNFMTPEFTDETADSVEITSYENAINEYKTRITDCNNITLSAIANCLKSESDIDRTAIYALLPSIYQTKAIVTLNLDDISKYDVPSYASVYDLVHTMIEEAISFNNSFSNKK